MMPEEVKNAGETVSVFVQFVSETGEESGTPVQLTGDLTAKDLTRTVDSILDQDADDTSYQFFVKESTQILDTLSEALIRAGVQVSSLGTEELVRVTYQPQAVFKVRAVTRCTSTLPGHEKAVLVALYSPDGRYMATGSGDKTVRLWDLNAEMPQYTCSGHLSSILCMAWSPDGERLASACEQGSICVWRGESGEQVGRTMIKHSPGKAGGSRWVCALAWKPIHLDQDCRYLVAAYKDSAVVIWDTVNCQPFLSLSGHTKSVTSVRWGGSDLLYTASQDCTIKVWRASDGVLCRTLRNHGHWVNSLALSTDYVLRTGPFDPAEATLVKKEVNMTRSIMQERAKAIYDSVKRGQPERLVAGSDDNTLSLWTPEVDKSPLCDRMTGHQGVVNDVKFSPDARLIASASFDKHVKIWDGNTGQFLKSLHGHVQAIYLVAWSADSRLLVSASKDSTLKLWDLDKVRLAAKKRHLLMDLPGHADEVYAVDWSPDGLGVVSGGKDKVVKIWRT